MLAEAQNAGSFTAYLSVLSRLYTGNKCCLFFHSFIQIGNIQRERERLIDQVMELLVPGFLFIALHAPFMRPFLTPPFWLPRRFLKLVQHL